MSQWGRNDQAVTSNSTVYESNGAPMGTWSLVKGGGGATAHNTDGTRANTDVNMFGNTTVSSFITGQAVGVFGVDPTEATGVTGGPIAETYVTFGGSGYKANATVTITVTNGGSSGVVNAHASGGRIDQLKIQTAGSGYITNPTITVAAPDLLIFNGNTNVTPNSSIGAFITYASANSYLQVNDKVVYAGNATSTPVTLVNNRAYYVSFANTSGFKVSDSPGSANINFAQASGDNTTAGGATFQGETATGYVVSGGNKGTGIAHAGWVVRREGTGGRAGRVQYETLVAMGSLGQTNAKYGTAATTADASDDTILPDS